MQTVIPEQQYIQQPQFVQQQSTAVPESQPLYLQVVSPNDIFSPNPDLGSAAKPIELIDDSQKVQRSSTPERSKDQDCTPVIFRGLKLLEWVRSRHSGFEGRVFIDTYDINQTMNDTTKKNLVKCLLNHALFISHPDRPSPKLMTKIALAVRDELGLAEVSLYFYFDVFFFFRKLPKIKTKLLGNKTKLMKNICLERLVFLSTRSTAEWLLGKQGQHDVAADISRGQRCCVFIGEPIHLKDSCVQTTCAAETCEHEPCP